MPKAIKKYSRSLACMAMAFMGCCIAWCAPAVTVRASADSTMLVQGDRVKINVEVLKNNHHGALIGIPAEEGADFHGLEFREINADSSDYGNDRILLTYHVFLQAFDPAEVITLPPFRYVVDGDTVSSEALSLKVYPVDLSPELGDPEDVENLTIHPSERAFAISSRWYDWIPNWWYWVLIGLIVACAGTALYYLYKKNGKRIFYPAKPLSPYEEAVGKMRSLADKHLIQQGQPKLFYTELIDILRNYLSRRFGINAMEMTSKQILQRVRQNKEIHLTASQMEQVLQLADFVKFAAARPDPSEGERTFQAVSQFLEYTKPQPEPQEKDNAEKN